MTTKITTDNIASETLTTILGPKVSSIVYPGDDTAANTAGGDSITLLGSGFNNGASVVVNGTSSGVVTVVSSTQITFTAPAQTAGTYVIYVINSDGGTAISIPGISYSGTPTWSTSAGNIGVGYETGSISTTVTASGDAPITYSVVSGTLPTGSSLNTSSGLISGTASATASSTTYSFTIKATDAQNQDTNRAFSITVNPDVVTWSSPANSTTYNVFTNSAIANVEMSATSASGGSITYTADTLPTGLSITGANIAGTPTVVASTTTTLTATSTSTRSATRTINWVVSIANDTYFKNVTLLLNGETTVTPFISDASANSFGLTINGDTKPVLFNPYTPGYYSNLFDGTGDYLSLTNTFTYAGNFTIEAWFYPSVSTITAQAGIFGGTSGSFVAFYALAANKLECGIWGSSGIVTSAGSFNLNQWNHAALVRSGSTIRWYINGVQDSATATNSSTLTQVNPSIGASPGASWNGYISNLRVVNGTALYTTNFTPSTTPLTAIANTSLLTCQSNRLIDTSTNAFTITKNGDTLVSPNIPFTQNSSYSTYGSAYFDGTGDYLSIPTNAAFQFGTGDFTCESWVYISTTPPTAYVLWGDLRWSTGYSSGWCTHINSNLTITSKISGTSGSWVEVTSTATVKLSSWNHVAVSRASGTFSNFINGVLSGSQASANYNYTNAEPFKIGIAYIDGLVWPLTGYIADCRVIKGTAIYTANFTPPTSPLTAIANTSLLTLQYNGGATNQAIIDNSNFNNIVTRFGNTSQGSFSPYSVTGWSNYFDTSGTQYISLPTSTATAFGGFNSNYTTIEFWAFQTTSSTGATNEVIGTWAAVAANGRFYVEIGNGASSTGAASKVFFTWTTSTGAVDSITTTAVVSVNQWVHIAIVVDATPVAGSHTVNIYVNGTGQSFTGRNFSSQTTTYDRLRIAGNSSSYFNGYLSNLRVVRGTSNIVGYSGASITVPANPFVPSIGTVLLTCQSNRFIDNSPINSTLTLLSNPSVQAFDPFGSVPEAVPISYSNYFDGTGDYLQTPTAVFGLGTIFTVEAWVYPTELVTGAIVFASTASGEFSLGYNSTTRFGVSARAVAWLIDSTTLPTLNAWNHIVVSRGGLGTNQTSLFINGVRVANSTVNNVFTTMSTWQVGYDNGGGGGLWKGNISNLRVVAGTDVYGYTNTTLTSPSAPLTAIANTSLLTCQSTRMIDNSTNNFTLTAAGDVKPRIFNPFGYTAQSATSYTPTTHGGSAYFDGTGDYLNLANNTAWSSLSGDFTIECWFYFMNSTLQQQVLFTQRSSSNQYVPYLFWTSNATIVMYSSSDNGSWNIISNTTVVSSWTPQTWNHFAFTRSGSTNRIFFNGVQTYTYTNSSSFTNSGTFNLGMSPGETNTATYGYVTDARLTKTAIYTSNFLPPAQALSNYSTTNPASLLLNFNNGGIIDQHGTNVLETVGNAQLSTAVKKYNNGSIYFDGTGDSLKILDNPNINLGSGDFTLECWVYFNVVNAQMTIISKGWNSSSAYASYLIWMNSDATLRFLASSNGGAWDIASERQIGTMTASTWTHIAVTRSGTSFRAFINGTIVDAFTFTSSASLANIAAQTLFIGDRTNGGTSLNGYIDDLRITKGYARYTSNFTAPTSAFITK